MENALLKEIMSVLSDPETNIPHPNSFHVKNVSLKEIMANILLELVNLFNTANIW